MSERIEPSIKGSSEELTPHIDLEIEENTPQHKTEQLFSSDYFSIWGTVIFLPGLTISIVLIAQAGLVTKHYSSQNWGENGFYWPFIYAAITVFFQCFLFKVFYERFFNCYKAID